MTGAIILLHEMTGNVVLSICYPVDPPSHGGRWGDLSTFHSFAVLVLGGSCCVITRKVGQGKLCITKGRLFYHSHFFSSAATKLKAGGQRESERGARCVGYLALLSRS